MELRALAIAGVVSGCAFHPGEAPSGMVVDAPGVQDAPSQQDTAVAPVDGETTTCLERWHAGTIRFDPPTAITEINSSAVDRDPFVSPDELTIYFSSERPGGAGTADIYTATRTTTGTTFSTFSTPATYPPATTPGYDSKMSMTIDGLLLVVASDQPGTKGLADIWQAQRASTLNTFNTLDESHEGAIDDTLAQLDPELSSTGLDLYFSDGGNPQQIELATRSSTSMDFAAATVISEIANAANQADPTVSQDETILLYSSGRGDAGFAGGNIWYVTRATTGASWGTPQPVPDVNTPADEGDAHLSADGCRLYFASDAVTANSWDIYVANAK